MAKNDNLTEFLTDVANAIRAKKGTSAKINPQDFSSEIASISTGGGNTPTPDMPVIGDGKTYLYIKIAEKGRMTVPLYFSQTVANGVTIDWGDGSATETLSGTENVNATHTYADIGEYTISLDPSSGCTLGLGHSSSSYCVIGSIGNNGRVYCNMLQAVEIGNGVTSIGSYAFTYCCSLGSVYIPENVTSIGDHAFYYCYSLESVVIPGGVTSIENHTFYYCYSLKSVVLPEGLTSIGNYAFNYCQSLSSIEIPQGVTSIGNYVFAYCSSLESVIIPEGAVSIGNNTFHNCQSLASVVLPEGLVSLGSYAFGYCYSLASVVVPKSVTTIGGNAFSYCYGMAYYDFSALDAAPTLSGTVTFASIYSDCKIVVPDALYDAWIAATNWSKYANNIIKASEFNG